MKIVYFTDTFLPQINGVVTSVNNFSKELAKKGHKVYIFTTKQKGRPAKIDLGENIKIIQFPSSQFLVRYPDFNLAHPKILRTMRLIKKIKPDIIHTHAPSPHGWTAIICAKMYGIPIVSTYHTLLPDFLMHSPIKRWHNTKIAKRLTWKYTRAYYNKVNVTVTPSNAMKKELERHGVKRVLFVSNGINTKTFYKSKAKQKKRKGISLLHVGRISYEKNIDVILKAYKIVQSKNKDISFDITGSGPDLEDLKKLSIKLGVNANFTGPMPHEKLRDAYNNHDIFVTASTIETEGLVILEAMSCGLPIVGVDKLAIPDIVKNGYNGYIAKPYDEKEMAEYILKIAKDAKLRKKFSENSIKISKEFELEKSIDKIERVYNELCRRKKK